MSQRRIREWYEAWDGQVYVSFSGGKDSTVLLHLVREIYPNVLAVFVDTGLEYPEIREFVKATGNVEWLKPKMGLKQVIEKYGYPVISKEQSAYIQEYRTTKSDKLKNIRMCGNKKGRGKISVKWRYLIDAPFKIGDKCCDVMKKKPFHVFEKDTGLHPIIGVMASESVKRVQDYMKFGCNAFNAKKPISRAIAFWTEEDIWEYLKSLRIPYSTIYDMGYTRTGCMFCGFGSHLETSPNRFQRMKSTHPKQWEYCMFNLGMAEVLDYIGVEWGRQMEIEDYIV